VLADRHHVDETADITNENLRLGLIGEPADHRGQLHERVTASTLELWQIRFWQVGPSWILGQRRLLYKVRFPT